MCKIKLTALLVLFISPFLVAQQADDIIGRYRLPNRLDIQIFENNNKYHGRIIGLTGEQKKDAKNPDKSKRNDLLVGKVIITDLEFDEVEKQWVNGNMYGPEKGMFFNLKITKIREREIEVVGAKYIFWKTLTWQKI